MNTAPPAPAKSSTLKPAKVSFSLKDLINTNTLVVHGTRIFTKVALIIILNLTHNIYALPLSIYMLCSEILDQALLYLRQVKPRIASLTPYIYALNSVAVISAVAYFGRWALNDFYFVYLIHISSATIGYGVRVGLTSFILSLITYSAILFLNQAPMELYLRLPLISVLVLRLLTTQKRYETTDVTLSNVLSVEKSKQDFIGLASHNLRTPVAAIYGYIELLSRGDSGPLNEEQISYLQKIKSNNQELEKLTEQLLQISILEVGKEINLLKQPSQIETVIEDVIENFKPAAQSKNLSLTFQKPDQLLPPVDIDVEKVKSVISNLIDNAIKYTEKGSVTVSAKREGDSIIISVKDSGIGISAEDLPKVFTKFFRSGNILVYNKTGVGLGLFLGKRIIELHGGKITVESTPGQGSTFIISLPIIKEQSY